MPKKKRARCKTPFCRNLSRRDGADCGKCNMRKWREKNREKAAYARLRESARKRNISFTITFEEFVKFAKKTEYLTRTGNTAGSLTVDRKDNLRGYEPGNIRAITRSENSHKNAKQDECRIRKGYSWTGSGVPESSCPF